MTPDEAIQRAKALQDKIFVSYNLIQYLGGDPNSVTLPKDGDWIKWLACEIYLASQPDRNMEGVDEFIRAVLMNQPIWPNTWGQDVAAAAFFLTNKGQRATALETGISPDVEAAKNECSGMCSV